MQNPFGAVDLFHNAAKFMDAYAAVMQPVCHAVQLPPVALDVLLFLANNPDWDTARDICRFRGLKPGIVSFHVDHLVADGYLTRTADPTDRRRTHLHLTPLADPVIALGRARQRQFAAATMQGLSDDALAQLREAMAHITQNIESIRQCGLPAAPETQEDTL